MRRRDVAKRLTAKKVNQFIDANFDVSPEEFEARVEEFLKQFPRKKVAEKPVRAKRGIGSY